MPTDGQFNYTPPANPYSKAHPKEGRHEPSAKAVLDRFERSFLTGLQYANAMTSDRNIIPEGDAHRDAQALAVFALDAYVESKVAEAVAALSGDGR